MTPDSTSLSKNIASEGCLRVAMCQLNTTVGDITGNKASILNVLEQAEQDGCSLAVFPELTICGYPPEDLLFKSRFIADCAEAVEAIAKTTAGKNCYAIVGFPALRPETEIEYGQPRLYNAAAICGQGEIQAVTHKAHLPNYSVFDEQRYFASGKPHPPVEVNGVRVGVSICEDLWVDNGAVNQIARNGSEIIVNINASPYHINKWDSRQSVLEKRCLEHTQPFVYVNLVGGQDELVFDGMSAVFDASGRLYARALQFVEDYRVVDVPIPALQASLSSSGQDVGVPKRSKTKASLDFLGLVASSSDEDIDRQYPIDTSDKSFIAPRLDPLGEIYEALKLGLKDYIHKTGFEKVCVGLSGGIDSSLVAAIAVDALGADKVHGVLMPSRYSSDHSVADAKQLCANFGIEHSIVPIEPAHSALESMLGEHLGDLSAGLTEENLQARIRGVIMMAYSNARSWLNLTTGNKSELAVGYSTLYGDTAGAFAVIKDVWKLQVYTLAEYRNQFAGSKNVIPENVLVKPPSAELSPGQRDDASLPPYETLDPMLFALVEQDMTAQDLLIGGNDPETVTRIARLIDISEYKRRQSPLGTRITQKAFGKDRRMPITNCYQGINS